MSAVPAVISCGQPLHHITDTEILDAADFSPPHFFTAAHFVFSLGHARILIVRSRQYRRRRSRFPLLTLYFSGNRHRFFSSALSTQLRQSDRLQHDARATSTAGGVHCGHLYRRRASMCFHCFTCFVSRTGYAHRKFTHSFQGHFELISQLNTD